MKKDGGLGGGWCKDITASKPSHREQKYVPGNDPGQERPISLYFGCG